MAFLIDTNVLSEYARPQPEANVLSWLERMKPEVLFASVMTLGELRLGVEDLPVGKRRAELEAWLATGLPVWFDRNLLPITAEICHRWAKLTIAAKRGGTPIGMADGLIAATALEHGLTLVTRNVKDFTGTDIILVNPWEPQS